MAPRAIGIAAEELWAEARSRKKKKKKKKKKRQGGRRGARGAND
jgi:hypothetical protein